MLRFARACAALCVAAVPLSTTAAPAGPPDTVAVVGSRQNIPTAANQPTLMVAIVPLAKQLGMPVKSHGGAVQIEVDGAWISVSRGEMIAREETSPMLTLSAMP